MSASLPSTPSQTVGPFLAIGLPWADGHTVVDEETSDAIWLRGTVLMEWENRFQMR